jgi:hypothetical protein
MGIDQPEKPVALGNVLSTIPLGAVPPQPIGTKG